MPEVRVIFEPYRPGVPLRPWTTNPGDDTAIAAELTAKASGAIDAVQHLIADEELSLADVVAIGRLNFHCFLGGWEPMVALYDDIPKLDPCARVVLQRHSKRFRKKSDG